MVLLAVATGCGADDRGDDRPGEDPARAACRAAFPDGTVTDAFPTTVGEVRGRAAGPGLRPAATAWPGRGDADPAAWCYVDTAADSGEQRTAGAAIAGQPGVVFGRGDLPPSSSGPFIP